ncbi:DUF4430 domain-containing protein [Acetoanaerobium noterae]|uniref:DUF4430 domain-containing protein n=1 Tax=Acetoanaerobium noterae TaxID=745369 RepID=UPI0033284389
MKKQKNKIIIGIFIILILCIAYFWGGNYAKGDTSYTDKAGSNIVESNEEILLTENIDEDAIKSEQVDEEIEKENMDEEKVSHDNSEAQISETSTENKNEESKKTSSGMKEGSIEYSINKGMVIDETTGKDKYLTDPVPEGKPLPVEPQNVTVKDNAGTVTLSVRCDTILNNMNILKKEKWELVPASGIIYPASKVTFYEGESVFNVLQREMKKNGIHMEFRNTPIYNSAYIRGINNLYEFDVGELSGWMYKVNGWFPNYGASRYQLKDGDVIEWVYTTDLGRDVGGYYAVGGE